MLVVTQKTLFPEIYFSCQLSFWVPPSLLLLKESQAKNIQPLPPLPTPSLLGKGPPWSSATSWRHISGFLPGSCLTSFFCLVFFGSKFKGWVSSLNCRLNSGVKLNLRVFYLSAFRWVGLSSRLAPAYVWLWTRCLIPLILGWKGHI